MRLDFFSKCSKVYEDSKKALKYQHKVVFFRINAFELVPVNSPFYAENTWHRQTMG